MCNICDDTFFLSRKQRVQLSKELNIDDIVNNAINQLYDDRVIDDATKKQLLQTHYEPLKLAVEEGYGKKLVNIEYGTPNYEFLKNLQTNTAVFASFKNHSSIKEMVKLLKDENGNLRNRDSFKQEALKIDSNYRGSKLDAEYDTAVRQARMAANWQKYEKNKRLYPNLKYILTKAANPDEKHLKYVGIIRPVDDPFWNTHYPPNRWRCQCSVEQTDDDATDIPNNLPPIPADFAFNSGKLAQVFDIKNSEYIKAAKPNEQPALIKEAKKVVNAEIAIVAPYQNLYTAKNGATVKAHPLAMRSSDIEENLIEGRELAKQLKQDVKVLPVTTDPFLRDKILPKDAKGFHCPDYDIEGIGTIELKTLTVFNESTLDNALKRAYKQCNQIAIALPDNIDINFLKRRLNGQFKNNFSSMKTLMLKIDGNWIVTSRERIKNDDWDF